VFEWAKAELGVTINEMFGQTEINYVVGNCQSAWPAKAGSIGRPYPGHRVAVVDDQGKPLPPNELGEIAVNRRFNGQPDPVFFLEYWKNEKATKDKFIGDWGCTGDQAKMDEDGYLWYQGRSDDVIKSAGYRIGPAEIESCLVKHPAVLNAAVIGKPDATRGSIVKAFIVLQPGNSPSEKLIDEIQNHVKGRLAPYEYPREIEFIDALPMTTTGKVQRKELRKLEDAKLQKA
jgi:acetyl-CoA synthetase